MGVRGIGATRAEAFEQAALALISVICDPENILPREAVEIHCQATDDELLLVDWLNALIYEMATRHMLFGRFTVRLDNHSLRATAWGEPLSRARHRPAVEVKGATYTDLRVAQAADGSWSAQCVVDI